MARRLGIAVVQQELSLMPHLSIAENITLGAPPRRFGLIDYGAMATAAAAAAQAVELDDPLDCRSTGCRSAGGRWWRSPRRCTASRGC